MHFSCYNDAYTDLIQSAVVFVDADTDADVDTDADRSISLHNTASLMCPSYVMICQSVLNSK